MSIKVFRDIAELLTLSGAAKKQGRKIDREDLSIHHNGALVIKGKKILWAGTQSEMPRIYKKARSISLKGSTVLPAFIESHTHLIFAGNRSEEFEKRNQGVTYQEINEQGGGIRSTMKATREATLSELVKLGQKRVNLFVRQGVTTIEAKTGYGLNTETEFKILSANHKLKGARIISTYMGPHSVPPEFDSAEKYIEHITKNDIPLLKKKKLTCRCDIFVEKGFFEGETARSYLKAVRDAGFDIVIHADQLTLSGGSRMAIEFDARSADHLLQIEKPEIEALAKSEVTCVLLPTSDLYLRTKYPQARALIDAGARVALATDFNPGTSPTQDLALVGVLARLEMKMSLPEVIASYTVGASYALGLEKVLGSLEPGKLADFSVVEGTWQDLFYHAGHMPISQVWREGQRVFA
jgi:imidazolonepropionase